MGNKLNVRVACVMRLGLVCSHAVWFCPPRVLQTREPVSEAKRFEEWKQVHTLLCKLVSVQEDWDAYRVILSSRATAELHIQRPVMGSPMDLTDHGSIVQEDCWFVCRPARTEDSLWSVRTREQFQPHRSTSYKASAASNN